MKYLPVSIDTEGKNILVVGAGSVALRKVQVLLKTDFKIYVFAQEISEAFYALAQAFPHRLLLKTGQVDENFVFYGYDYLLIATSDDKANDYLETYAKDRKIPYIRSDKKSRSPLIMNKVIQQGSLCLGVSTGGHNPTISRLVGEDLTDYLKKYSPEKLDILDQIREALVRKGRKDVSEIISQLWRDETINLNNYLEEIDEDKTRHPGQ
ncbi:MAG: bifunctional precorrin-2 dehydrogenase/sirohydrochlorin ferrochelatase [Tissierellia bacterium]|nr:bifunctional precorrin-2 dehydrogenase/sirohydrochlorin ferrochelatase [Tissierellia bacterium]